MSNKYLPCERWKNFAWLPRSNKLSYWRRKFRLYWNLHNFQGTWNFSNKWHYDYSWVISNFVNLIGPLLIHDYFEKLDLFFVGDQLESWLWFVSKPNSGGCMNYSMKSRSVKRTLNIWIVVQCSKRLKMPRLPESKRRKRRSSRNWSQLSKISQKFRIPYGKYVLNNSSSSE